MELQQESQCTVEETAKMAIFQQKILPKWQSFSQLNPKLLDGWWPVVSFLQFHWNEYGTDA